MSERVQIAGEQIEEALEMFETMLFHRLKEKGYGTFASTHEILGIITEEFQELVDAVKNNSVGEVHRELLDLAVGAVFAIACINQKTIDW